MGNDSNDALNARVDTLERQVDELFAKLNPALTNLALLSERIDTLLKSLDKIQTAIDSLTARPARRWDAAVQSGVTAVVAAIVGWLSAHIK